MGHLADDLPSYRVNILAKIAVVRGAGKGGSVAKLQETIEDIKTDLGQSSPPTGAASRPVVVAWRMTPRSPGRVVCTTTQTGDRPSDKISSKITRLGPAVLEPDVWQTPALLWRRSSTLQIAARS